MQPYFGALPTAGLCPTLRASLRGGAGWPHIAGTVRFYPWGEGTLVRLEAEGLPGDGFFAVHIHDTGDCRTGGDVAFTGAGGHFDPTGGAPHPDHAGDLPSLLSSGGKALMICYTGRFRPQDVAGRAVIIHAEPDDFRSQPAGAAGARIACGVIRPAR